MRVTLYLLRDGAKAAKETLRKPHLYQERQIRPLGTDESTRWRLFERMSFSHDVGWFEHLRPLLESTDHAVISAKSAGAVLLVQAHGRVFAVTFGTGFHGVPNASVEPDFGLKVTANCVGDGGLTMAEARGLGKGKRNASSRLALPGEVFALGLLTDEEWIRKFGGEVQVAGFAKSASGADALQLNIVDFDLFQLPDKLRSALDLFESDAYKQHFPFLDYFRRETNKEVITQLDEILADELRARSLDIGFASSDDFVWTPDSYVLRRYRRERELNELRTEDVYDAIDHLDGWQSPLKSVKVEGRNMDGGALGDVQPLRPYVVGSVRRAVDGGHHDYATTAGAWFRVDQEFVTLVDRYLNDNIADLTGPLSLPKWDDEFLREHVQGRYGEERYNRWVCQEFGFSLLDRDLYRGRSGEHVEICDMLTKDKQLICVKRMDGSDKMSHLFQQGSVSTQMLMTNDDYREKVMSKLRELDPAAEFGEPSHWTVVYAIATSKPGDLKDVMYFFSRAALRTHGISIKSNGGIKVAVAKIDRCGAVG